MVFPSCVTLTKSFQLSESWAPGDKVQNSLFFLEYQEELSETVGVS